MSLPRFLAVVVAAGSGERMGAGVPKQYLPLAGRTVLEHALQPLLDHPQLERLVVVLAADDTRFAATAAARSARVVTAVGGRTRAESVAAGLAELADAEADTPVLVHDGARPCLGRGDIDRLLAAFGPHGALLALPVRDTLKRAHADPPGVTATVDRADLWQALTPQAFPLGPLRTAIAAYGVDVTDESQAMERAGYAPVRDAVEAANLKVTHPGDVELAELILTRVRGRGAQ